MNEEIEIAKSKGFKQTDIDDIITIQNIKSGQEYEFSKIMDKYYDSIYNKMFYYCNRDSDKAKDITSDIMIKIYESLSKYSISKGKLKSWIHRLAYNTFIDGTRKSHKNLTHNAVRIDELFDTGESSIKNVQIKDETLRIDEQFESIETKNELYLALESLSDVERKIIELRYFGGLAFKEIAEEIEETENYCRIKIRRAKAKLKKLLE